jgi:glycerol-3-phosphate O-acyltransferase
VSWLGSLVGSVYGLERVAARLFAGLRVDDGFAATVRDASARGPVLFVLRSMHAVDALAVASRSAGTGLPRLGFAHDLPWLPRALDPKARRPLGVAAPAELRACLAAGETSVLFLKRRPDPLSATGRGRAEGDDVLEAVLGFVEQSGRDATLIPITLLWSLRPSERAPSLVDVVFGPSDAPGELRAVLQAAASRGEGALRVGEPIRVRAFLDAQEAGASRYTQVRRLTYALVSRLERERRAVVGPARKPPDRVREEVLRSPKLVAMIDDLASGDPNKRAVLEAKARDELERLAAAPNPDMLRAIDPVSDRLVARVFSGVDVEGIERVREAARHGNVVLLPSHKSHVDYLVLSWVLRRGLLELPMVAAGDNLAFFPVGELLRRGGAFFIRRDFRGDRLYTALVDAYVRRILKDGWALEFYLEGGRSRTGKLLAPKLGLLNLVVDAALSIEGRKVAFVPVSIAYDRMMEDWELSREKAGAKKERESAESLVSVVDALQGTYGRVQVCFGEPVELGALREAMGLAGAAPSPAKRRAIVSRIAARTSEDIHAATPLAGGPLVAMALLDMPGRGLAHPALVRHAERLATIAARAGARPSAAIVHADGRLRESALREAALVFVRGGLVKEHVPDETLRRGGVRAEGPRTDDEVVYVVPDEARGRLDLVKNEIVHFFAHRGVGSTAFLARGARSVPRAELLADAASLAKLLRHDLVILGEGDPGARLAATLDDLVAFGELAPSPSDPDALVVGAGNEAADAMSLLASHAAHLAPTLEAYRLAARAIRVLTDEPLDEAALLRRALEIGRQMFLGGELDRREAVGLPSLDAALEALRERGLLRRGRDAWELAPEATDDARKTLEAELGRYVLATRPGTGGLR